MKRNKGRPGILIMCANDGLIFESISEAAHYYSINQTAISKQINGDRNKAGGKHFVKIDFDTSEEELQKIRKNILEKYYGIKQI